jgi:adenine-specific DNA-methyltransferase
MFLNNLLINSDNLPALQSLKITHEKSIDLIYIDPPYNTGKQMGKYKDSFPSHPAWVDFMRPRLEAGISLMKSSAMIFISISHHELPRLMELCADLFDESNFVSLITWQCKYTVANDKKSGISAQTEYILVYAIDKEKAEINRDIHDATYIKRTYKNPDNDFRGPWRQGVQLFKKKTADTFTVTSPTGKQWTKGWNYSEQSWKDKLEKNNLIYWGPSGNLCPVKKVFLKDVEAKGCGIGNLWEDESESDIWMGKDVGFTADGGTALEAITCCRSDFIYPKPVELLKRIVRLAAPKDGVVLDFFAGSGTTGHAVLLQNAVDKGNRKFILVTNNENNICEEVTKNRITKVMEGYTDCVRNVDVAGLGGEFIYTDLQGPMPLPTRFAPTTANHRLSPKSIDIFEDE